MRLLDVYDVPFVFSYFFVELLKRQASGSLLTFRVSVKGRLGQSSPSSPVVFIAHSVPFTTNFLLCAVGHRPSA
jgi:hypothetical protein